MNINTNRIIIVVRIVLIIMKLTTLDYAILGLLKQEAQSGYQIRQAFESTALGNYSSSPGSIYPALKKLEKQNLIINTTQDAKSKFTNTNEGETALRHWLESPIDASDFPRNIPALILKFAFMDSGINSEIKIQFLTDFKNHCQAYLNGLQAFHNEHQGSLPKNGLWAFEHGLKSYEAHIAWAESILSKI